MLSLVFARGHRPDADSIAQLAQAADARLPFSISHAPGKDEGWLELLAMGLTFDCRGLAPAEAAPMPRRAVMLGLDIAPRGEPIALAPGPHLAEGPALLPVVRVLVGLGARLAGLPGALAVCWGPAATWMAPDYFRKVAGDWLDGGPFPALGLAALHRDGDDAMVSHGLAFFIGQELRIEPAAGLDPAGMARIAVRLMNELVESGPLAASADLIGPRGERLRADLRPDRALIRVSLKA